MFRSSVPRRALLGVVGVSLAGVLLGLGSCDGGSGDEGATQTTRPVAVPSGQDMPERQDVPERQDEPETDDDVATATLSGSRSPLNKVRETFAREAAQHVYDHPDVFAGVGWTGENYWHFTIQVAEDHLDAPEVAWVRERVPDDQVHMVHLTTVAHSSSDLQRVMDLLEPRMEDREVIGLGEDFLHNAVRVVATPENIAAGGGHDAFLRDLTARLPADLRDAVVLEQGEMPTVGSADEPEVSLRRTAR